MLVLLGLLCLVATLLAAVMIMELQVTAVSALATNTPCVGWSTTVWSGVVVACRVVVVITALELAFGCLAATTASAFQG